MIRELHPVKMSYGKIDDRIRTWYNPNLDSRNFYVPGIVAFLIMLLVMLLTSMAIIREKESGTMEQLMVTPLKPFEMILGKTIPFILIAQAQMILVTIFAIFWFDIPLVGSIPLLWLATCLFLLSTLGVGLFISTVSATQQQAMMTTFFFILPFFHAQRVCVSRRQYAQGGAVADLSESAEIFFDNYPGRVFKRNRTGCLVAPVCRPSHSGLGGVLGRCPPVPEAVGLI